MITSFISIPTLLIAAFLIPVAGIHEKKMAPYIAILATLISFTASLLTISQVQEKNILIDQMGGWSAPYGITLAIDSFSLMIIILITLIGTLAAIFSLSYIKNSQTEYYSLLCLLFAGLLGIAHTGDFFNLFIFLEITAISSYALTAFYTGKKSIEASIKYLIMGAFATSMILLGIALIYGLAGTLNMADLADRLDCKNNTDPTNRLCDRDNPTTQTTSYTIPIIIGLLMTGLAFKSAIAPLHAWKPDVLEASPAPIGAIFASISTTVSLYAIIRIAYTVFSIKLTYILLTAGTITMLIGAILAMQQKDIMRLLAYSAISQVGYILIAFATDTTAGIYHLFNVTIIEALLFLSVGAIILNTKETDMKKISKTATYHPLVPIAFMIGILSNAGIPLLNGFSSKWLIYTTTLQSYPLITIAAVLTSVLTLAYSLKAYQTIFSKRIRPSAPKKLIDPGILTPLIILALICIYFGIFANQGADIAKDIASTLKDNQLYIETVLRQ